MIFIVLLALGIVAATLTQKGLDDRRDKTLRWGYYLIAGTIAYLVFFQLLLATFQAGN